MPDDIRRIDYLLHERAGQARRGRGHFGWPAGCGHQPEVFGDLDRKRLRSQLAPARRYLLARRFDLSRPRAVLLQGGRKESRPGSSLRARTRR